MTIAQTLSSNSRQRLPFPASTAVSLYDFLVWNATNKQVQEITSLTSTGSEEGDQALVASLFIGLSGDVRLATETDANAIRTVVTEGIFDVSCVSFTPQPGSLVGVTWNGGSALVNGVVKNVLSPDLAIGMVIDIPTQQGNTSQWGNAQTVVRCKLFSRVIRDLAHMYGSGTLEQATIAAAGSAQGSAAALTALTNIITGASGSNGVILPAGAVNLQVTVINTSASNALLVYPDSGGTLNGGAANASASLAAKKGATYVCTANAGTSAWWSVSN